MSSNIQNISYNNVLGLTTTMKYNYNISLTHVHMICSYIPTHIYYTYICI